MPTTAPAPIYPGHVLRVHNQSDQTLRLTWDGRSTVIPPGEMKFCSFEQVVNHFGHPAAGGEPQKIEDPGGGFHVVPTRDEERRRVSIKQGWDLRSPHTGGLQELTAVPPFAIYDMDDNRIWTVADDPDGDHALAVVAPEQRTPADRIAYMERQLAMMKAEAGVPSTAPSLAVPGVSPAPPDGAKAGVLPDLDIPTDD